MSQGYQEGLIIEIAKILTNKKLEANSIDNVFPLICEEFGFESLHMYELNDNHTLLQLTQNYGSLNQTWNVPKSFSADLYRDLSQETVVYYDGQSKTTEEAAVLSLFGVQSAVLAFAAEENGSIYSLIILCNTICKNPLEENLLEYLKLALSMICDYITIQKQKTYSELAQTTLESILDNTGIDIYVNDFYNHDILYVNESMATPYGGKSQFAGRKCWQVLFPGQTGPCEFCPQNKMIDEGGNPTKVYTWDYQRAFDGSWFRVFSVAFRQADGRLAHVVSSADITDNKHNEELVRYMANYDVLTNLPNRRMLVEDCEARINQASEEPAFLLFFDIDGFKNVNDTLGHDAGDEFLIELGKFFLGIPMLKGSTYRNGGDEFVAMLGNGITKEHIRDLAWFIQRRFQKPWNLKKGTVVCGISIGAAQYPKDGVTAEELLRKADKAMYHVKKSGGGGLYFASNDLAD